MTSHCALLASLSSVLLMATFESPFTVLVTGSWNSCDGAHEYHFRYLKQEQLSFKPK